MRALSEWDLVGTCMIMNLHITYEIDLEFLKKKKKNCNRSFQAYSKLIHVVVFSLSVN